jgi:hypothetical protein
MIRLKQQSEYSDDYSQPDDFLGPSVAGLRRGRMCRSVSSAVVPKERALTIACATSAGCRSSSGVYSSPSANEMVSCMGVATLPG